MKYVVPVGRILYSIIFLMTARVHFSKQVVAYATSAGVPMADLLVPLSGVAAIAGGLSIALGYKAKAGAWFIVIFLIPVSYYMHAFWKETDAMQMQMQMSNFFKNISMLGAALLITYFGSGPISVDALFDNRDEPGINVKRIVKEEVPPGKVT